MFDRIAFDPQMMGGRACIRGMRITVSLVVNLVANGMSTGDIIREYPELEPEGGVSITTVEALRGANMTRCTFERNSPLTAGISEEHGQASVANSRLVVPNPAAYHTGTIARRSDV